MYARGFIPAQRCSLLCAHFWDTSRDVVGGWSNKRVEKKTEVNATWELRDDDDDE